MNEKSWHEHVLRQQHGKLDLQETFIPDCNCLYYDELASQFII